ncbi:MAG: CotH kinase family protein [Ignavibacteriaceae bacterium]|nr:CotH kinase family protein [Ignavibacteriaceae bacterium]
MKKLPFTGLLIINILLQLDVYSVGLDIPQKLESSSLIFTSSNLPIVVINTNGQPIVNDKKITADMGIIYNGEGIRNYLTDPFNNFNGKIGIELRGSSSQMFPKKQYAVETRDSAGNDLDVSLLGFPPESDWILFAPYNDKTLIRDVLAYKLANDFGCYASRSKFCEVVLNNEYVGVYVLLEKIKRDANRVNIKKLEPADISGDALTGGYIIKIDKSDGENNSGWLSNYLPFQQTSNKVYYQYHYPAADEIVQAQKNYIQTWIFNFETVMKYSSNIADTSTGYPKYLDVNSFVDFVLINEITKNVDGYRLSTYFYKDRDSKNTKLFAGPVWDFNLGFGNADYYEGGLTTGWQLQYLTNYSNMSNEAFLAPFWWRKLFDDTNFRNNVYARWNQLRTSNLKVQNILNTVDSLTTLLSEAKTRNFERWQVIGQWVWPNYFVGQTYEQEIAFLKGWITNRIYWLDANMIGEPTNLRERNDLMPFGFSLSQNYPNPFNPNTTFEYSVPMQSYIQIVIFDVMGNCISTIVEETKSPGKYSVEFDAFNLSSGIYYCKMNAADFTAVRKIILLK